MKFKKGRQGTNYLVLTLFSWLRYDFHLIYVPSDISILSHYDEVKPIWEHYRINLCIGGYNRICIKGITQSTWYCKFRPDISEHKVDTGKWPLFIVSIGWVKKNVT